MVVNHLMYTDGICVFNPSNVGCNAFWMNTYGDYAAEHTI